jgi:hypothetical protein
VNRQKAVTWLVSALFVAGYVAMRFIGGWLEVGVLLAVLVVIGVGYVVKKALRPAEPQPLAVDSASDTEAIAKRMGLGN